VAGRKSVPPPSDEDLPPLPPPARTLEGREDQLIAMAFDLVERRLREGTASSQETTHFLKLGSTRNKLEARKIDNENLLLQARIQQIGSQESGENLLERALQAFRGYSGQEYVDPEAQEYDDPNLYGPQ
jgi:hypothetical protein